VSNTAGVGEKVKVHHYYAIN